MDISWARDEATLEELEAAIRAFAEMMATEPIYSSPCD